MVNLLIKFFIKDSENFNNPKIREKYGILSGGVGIFCNLLLSATKFFIGIITNSISITADAINNLSDACSSIVGLLGFKLSGKSADKKHPFGYGRFEYLSSLIVSFVILLMGFELIKSSFGRITSPEHVVFSYPAMIVLIISILVKLWMAYFNNKLGKKISSNIINAVVIDSLSDTAVTSLTILSLILSKFSDIPFDGYFGLFVALFILYAGFKVLKGTVNDLLGHPPTTEFVNGIEDTILSFDGVLGVHDLIIHDYGPNRVFASVHVEVDSSIDININHDVIDNIEKEINEKFNVMMVIHMDPLTNTDEVNGLKEITQEIVTQIDPEFTIHDFRIVKGPTHTNFIFDLVTPNENKLNKKEIIDTVSSKIKEIDSSYNAVVTVEHGFI